MRNRGSGNINVQATGHVNLSMPHKVSAQTAGLLIGCAALIGVAVIVGAFMVEPSHHDDPHGDIAARAPLTTTTTPVASPNAAPVTEAPQWSPLQVAYVSSLSPEPGDEHFTLSAPATVDPATFGTSNISDMRGKLDGIVVGMGITKFTVQNQSGQAVDIVDMSVVKNCGKPYSDTVFEGYSQGAPTSKLTLGVNLDDPEAVVQEVDPGIFGGGFDTYYVGQAPLHGADYFAQHTVPLNAGEEQSFTVGVFAEHHSCTFTIRLVVASVGHPTVYVDIAPPGRPSFVMTAPLSEYHNGGVAERRLPGRVLPEQQRHVVAKAALNRRARRR